MELDLLVQFVMYMLAKLETIKFKTAFLSPPSTADEACYSPKCIPVQRIYIH